MNQNAVLAEIRRLILEVQNAEQEDARLSAEADLIEQFEALDAWLSKGGFLPEEWEVPVDPHSALAELRAAATALTHEDFCCAAHGELAGRDLAEKFATLDRWLSRGGFLPAEWRR